MMALKNQLSQKAGYILAGIPGIMFSSMVLAGVEKDIELTEVPEKALAQIDKKFPNSQLLSANTETEDDGSFVYEVQLQFEDGRNGEIDFLENSEIDEIEIEFNREMVPGAVLKSIEKKMPGFQPTYIEATHSAGMAVVGYEFQGLLNGAEMDIEVSADGRKITVADN